MMNRNDAIDLARAHALGHGQTGDHAYLPTTDAEAAEWLPHAWVVDAIVSAAAERERATVPLATESVVGAIYAVGAEAARRGEMFIAGLRGQLEDRHSVARVAEMLRWYEKNTGCARLRGWPDA